jgi:glutamate synthase (NADPH/NADH) large chain
MARQCHLNTCPTGIATQDKKLRERFKGKVEDVMAYFSALAQEVRDILSEMGFKSLAEIIGRTDLLSPAPLESSRPPEKTVLDTFLKKYPEGIQRTCTWERNDNPSPSMNDVLVGDLLHWIEKAEPVEREYTIRNIDRSIPVKLNYHISKRYGDRGLPSDTIRLTFKGTAGQSFGAFNHRGLSLTLIGDANDYVGKGMFGGKIVIRPHDIRDSHKHVIMGNTVLYGATGGEFYGAGRAGERFAVRNSGATAVIEGAGHHLCEYMTKGTVVVLGEAGYNIGAGMTDGILYLYDEHNTLRDRLNNSYVISCELEDEEEIARLKSLLENHHRNTGSHLAGALLNDFGTSSAYFKKVIPKNRTGCLTETA